MGFRSWARPLGLSDWCGGAGWSTGSGRSCDGPRPTAIGVDVAISQDLEEHPEMLEGPRLFLSVGHDEYWSWGMRDTFDAFVERGGNAAILSGNTCFWQVRFDDDHAGDDRLQVPSGRGPRPRHARRTVS